MSARVKRREDGKEWMVGVVGGNDRASVKAGLHKTWGASAGESVQWIENVANAWVKRCESRKERTVGVVREERSSDCEGRAARNLGSESWGGCLMD